MRQRSAYAVYLLTAGATGFLLATNFTTSSIYRFEAAGLNPLQLVLVGTALEATVFLCEIPTGVVADRVSRRLSVIVGYALIGAGFLLEGALPLFATILLAQAVWGLGITFISGASDAWLADELGEAKLPQTYLRGAQVGQVAGFLGIFAGTALASVRLNLPFLVAGGGMIALALILRLIMAETNFTPTLHQSAGGGEGSSWRRLGDTLGSGLGSIRARPLLLTILAITLVYGLYSEGLDRLWEAHLLTNFALPPLSLPPFDAFGLLDPIYWFALINGGVLLLTLLATEIIRRAVSRNVESMNHRQAIRLLVGFNVVMIVGLVGFGLAGNWAMAVAMYGAVSVARSTSRPIFMAWINRGIDPQVRATVLSTFGQMDAIGQTVAGPPVGAFATRFGLRALFILIGALLSPVLALYARAWREQ